MLEEVLALLRRDLLSNIVPLKMMAAYPTEARCRAAGEAALVLLPARVSPFDRQMYPGVHTVVMLSGSDPWALRALLPEIPRGERLVFKLSHPEQLAVVRQAFAPRRATAFHSFTAPPGSQYEPGAGVAVIQRPDAGVLALYAAQGYSLEEVDEALAHGNARVFAIYAQDMAVCACLAWRNYGPIYEIGALHTLPHERRKGHARQVVAAALAWVLGSGFTPRYQVNEQNEPSLRLAGALGLERFAVIEHWLAE
jgi:GNAT superfamily N-acetyltransferase